MQQPEESITVMRRMLASLLLLAGATFVLMGAGCAKRHKISIQSDSAWLGTIDRQTTAIFSDSGNATFRVAGEINCVSVLNQRPTGFVRVRIDEGAWSESALPHGTAETCR
jgi:hypothetical protein